MAATGSLGRLADGRAVFTKSWGQAPRGFFAAEVTGLTWLAETGEVAVPEVLSVDDDSLTVAGVPTGQATAAGARAFGRSLARLHARGAPGFGAPWAGFIGPLPMDNRSDPDWPSFYAERRVLPFLRAARDAGHLESAEAGAIEGVLEQLVALAGPSGQEPPSRIHGDLWSGNVLWDHDGRAWLIDPAAHGGHRESDLAMLALFGAPYLADICSAYEQERPLADGWKERVGLHQLHPLLVHAVLFGGAYGVRAGQVARGLLG